MEIETRVVSEVLKTGERTKYNFAVYNLDYSKEEVEIEHERKEEIYNYSRIEDEGIKLDSQVIKAEKDTSYEAIFDNEISSRNYLIEYKTFTLEEIVDKIYDEFEIRDWEGSILQLGREKYTKNTLPPREKIESIIRKSMHKVGIKGDKLVEKNAIKILQSFSTLLRRKSKTVVPKLLVNEPYKIYTENLEKERSGVGNLRRGSSVFFTNNYGNEVVGEDQKIIFEKLIKDESLPRSAMKEINEFLFKTPVNVAFASSEPERKFIDLLCKKNISKKIDTWIKSRDRNFYSIEFSLKYGSKNSKTRKYTQRSFNPDFFIKIKHNDYDYYVVVEIKADKDDSEENKAKYKYAKEHFERLNEKLDEQKIKHQYIFHFLSPNGYTEFFDYLKNGTLLEGQDRFRCELENMLEEDD